MTEAKHTPAPWVVDEDGDVVQEASGMVICTVSSADDFPCIVGDETRTEEQERADVDVECSANRLLISAAPDMAAAIQALTAKFDPAALVERDLPHSDLADEMRAVFAALSKAGLPQ